VSSAKAEVKSMIEGLPEDASLEDIQYHLYVLEKVKRGLERAESEGVISHEDAKARLGKWLAA
jgi:ribosomal protein S20